MPRFDPQQLLIALALHGDRNSRDFIRQTIRKIDIHQHVARHARIEERA